MSKANQLVRSAGAALVVAAGALWATAAEAQVGFSFGFNSPALALSSGPDRAAAAPFRDVLRDQAAPEAVESELPARLRREVVDYPTAEAPGTIIVDTPNTHLYFVLGHGKAVRYGIGVGRDGFTWSGVKSIERKAEWPDWVPPADMLQRQPYLPRFMAGGPGNPLGARAMYLGGTVYRIHGTNAPSTIGKHVSSGCIRMLNADVIDLFGRTHIGTKVVVLPDSRPVASAPRPRVSAAPAPAAPTRFRTSSLY
jgi:lipoprotein-anchoring transpeptidase ErfK/SrfK